MTERPVREGGKTMMEQDMVHHFTFADMLHSQGYAGALAEATCCKARFNDKVHPMEFKPGDMVQVYNSKLDVTYEAKAKIMPCWSPPRVMTD